MVCTNLISRSYYLLSIYNFQSLNNAITSTLIYDSNASVLQLPLPKMYLLALVSFLAVQVQAESPAAEAVCPVLFEGRVPSLLQLSDFDTTNTPFYSNKPSNVKWASILDFPSIQPSLFDSEYGAKPLEMRITDQSIVTTNNGLRQAGYRRSELIANDDGKAADVKTYHWSVKQGKVLNLTHEYTNVFVERRDGQGNNFAVVLGSFQGSEKTNWKVLDRYNSVIWQTPMLRNEWQNFAITLDHAKKYVTHLLGRLLMHEKKELIVVFSSIKVHYSQGYESLTAVTQDLWNENEQGAQFHVGVFKKSTGATDAQEDGYHESNIRESQIYGGIFIEDSQNECVSA